MRRAARRGAAHANVLRALHARDSSFTLSARESNDDDDGDDDDDGNNDDDDDDNDDDDVRR